MRTFIYRFTLANDVTEDIIQESMFEMLKMLRGNKKRDGMFDRGKVRFTGIILSILISACICSANSIEK